MDCFYPLKLNSNINEYKIKEDLILRKITAKEQKQFFGIRKLNLDENYNIKSFERYEKKCVFNVFDNVLTFIDTASQECVGSNYLLIASDDSNKETTGVIIFNKALKLFNIGRSGVFFGFYINSSFKIINPNPYYNILKIQTLNFENINEFKEIYDLIESNKNDEKINLIIEKYLFSLSGISLKIENRFLELMIILEMLYLPEGSNNELKFRLSLRIAKFFEKYFEENAKNLFDKFNGANGYYSIRSELIHKGCSDKLNGDVLEEFAEIVRKSIVSYLKNKDIFEDLNSLYL